MTAAELLLNYAKALKPNRLSVTGELDSSDIARAKLALDLYHKGPAFRLLAIAEEWSWERIVMELY